MAHPAPSLPSQHADRVPLGVALMIAFCAMAPLIDVAAKIASQEVSVGQVTLGRMVVQAVLMVPLVLLLRARLVLTRAQLGLLSLRAALLLASTFTFVSAVQVMPVADALAIAFVEPFIILGLGALLVGEHVGPRRIAAAAVGFLGALLVIQPNFAAFGLVALFPLGTALFFALYMMVTRRASREVGPVAMQLHTAWLGVVLMAPILGLGAVFEVPQLALGNASATIWGWLFGVGLAATVSHMAVTYALRFAPSSTLAPLHYLEIVTAVLFGYLFFGDLPNRLSTAGILLIVASGLYIIARERALARAARHAAR